MLVSGHRPRESNEVAVKLVNVQSMRVNSL